jgi:1-aminocyclopropane-1-carboxylate deaminase/D-cysteine desulfhydrase-like pyridoxal-dependent ACC family enzyme
MKMDYLLQHLELPAYTAQDLHVDVLRLDRIHPVVSGNKWFKLKYHLGQAMEIPGAPVLTFGGAWSNHLIATAFAAKQLGLTAVGIIRGERPEILSATLQNAQALGMQLIFIDRKEYAVKNEPGFLHQLTEQYPGAYIIPEGGGGNNGIRGSEDILRGIDSSGYTHICCAIGTGTTFLGLVRASQPGQQLIGVPVLKGMDTIAAIDPGNFLTPEQHSRCLLLPTYHFGGYARHPRSLMDFMNHFYRQTNIPTDIVYTGKLFYALCDRISHHFFPAHSRLLVIHSGGLQGNQSLSPGQLDF